MSEDEQIAICRVIAKACMWGQGGIASVIIDDLDKSGPKIDRAWREIYRENAKSSQRESVGVITDEKDLKYWLSKGYWLTNWDEDGCSLFNPPPMNGLMKYVSKDLADKVKADRERMEKIMQESSASFFQSMAPHQLRRPKQT